MKGPKVRPSSALLVSRIPRPEVDHKLPIPLKGARFRPHDDLLPACSSKIGLDACILYCLALTRKARQNCLRRWIPTVRRHRVLSFAVDPSLQVRLRHVFTRSPEPSTTSGGDVSDRAVSR